MKFKILITARTYDYSASYSGGNQHMISSPGFSHQVFVPPPQHIALTVVEFDDMEEAEFAVSQIASAGHTATRLYNVPSSNTKYWVPNIPTGV